MGASELQCRGRQALSVHVVGESRRDAEEATVTEARRKAFALRVSENQRSIFRFADGEAVDVDLIDYH